MSTFTRVRFPSNVKKAAIANALGDALAFLATSVEGTDGTRWGDKPALDDALAYHVAYKARRRVATKTQLARVYTNLVAMIELEAEAAADASTGAEELRIEVVKLRAEVEEWKGRAFDARTLASRSVNDLQLATRTVKRLLGREPLGCHICDAKPGEECQF